MTHPVRACYTHRTEPTIIYAAKEEPSEERSVTALRARR